MFKACGGETVVRYLIAVVLAILAIVMIVSIATRAHRATAPSAPPGGVFHLPAHTRDVATTANVQTIRTQLAAFISDLNRRPKSLQEMVDLNYLAAPDILDPWGEAYCEEWTEEILILTSKGDDRGGNTPDDLRYEVPIGGP